MSRFTPTGKTGSWKTYSYETEISNKPINRRVLIHDGKHGIDFDYKRKDGRTNLQAMKQGDAPVRPERSKNGIEKEKAYDLHHMGQEERMGNDSTRGTLVVLPHEIHQKYSKMLHGSTPPGTSFRTEKGKMAYLDKKDGKYYLEDGTPVPKSLQNKSTQKKLGSDIKTSDGRTIIREKLRVKVHTDEHREFEKQKPEIWVDIAKDHETEQKSSASEKGPDLNSRSEESAKGQESGTGPGSESGEEKKTGQKTGNKDSPNLRTESDGSADREDNKKGQKTDNKSEKSSASEKGTDLNSRSEGSAKGQESGTGPGSDNKSEKSGSKNRGAESGESKAEKSKINLGSNSLNNEPKKSDPPDLRTGHSESGDGEDSKKDQKTNNKSEKSGSKNRGAESGESKAEKSKINLGSNSLNNESKKSDPPSSSQTPSSTSGQSGGSTNSPSSSSTSTSSEVKRSNN